MRIMSSTSVSYRVSPSFVFTGRSISPFDLRQFEDHLGLVPAAG